MTYYCENYLSVKGNKEIIKKIKQAVEKKKLFETFIPIPKGVYKTNWCVENWGIRYPESDGVIISSKFCKEDESLDNNFLKVKFKTDKAPPIEFYKALQKKVKSLKAYYGEPYLLYYGIYDNLYEVTFNHFNNPYIPIKFWKYIDFPEDENNIFKRDNVIP